MGPFTELAWMKTHGLGTAWDSPFLSCAGARCGIGGFSSPLGPVWSLLKSTKPHPLGI